MGISVAGTTEHVSAVVGIYSRFYRFSVDLLVGIYMVSEDYQSHEKNILYPEISFELARILVNEHAWW